MKQYLLSILYLLAALALPATAQTSPQTKAAPDAPVMPYVVTVNEPTSGETAKKLSVRSEYPTSSYIIYKDGKAENGGVAYNTKEVKFDIATLPQGYFPAEGFPKVYETNAPNTAVSLTFANGVYTFTMPTKPVTIEVKYIKTDDLDLATLTEKATLTFKDGKWTYKVGTGGTPTLFTGTVKGANTVNTLTVNGNGGTLTLANGASVSSIVPSTSAVTLKVAKGGTATVADLTSASEGTLNVASSDANNGRLLVYLYNPISSNIKGLMQWKWKAAPEGTIVLYKPQTADNREEVLCTFSLEDKTVFATNIPDNTPVKLKVADKVQQGKLSKSDATILFSGKTSAGVVSFSEVKDIEPAKAPEDTNKGITITSGETYQEGSETDKILFDGSVKGEVASIKVDATVKDGAAIILDAVKKDASTATPVEVAEKAAVTLAVKGENAIDVKVKAGATLTLTSYDDKAKLNSTSAITNAGVFVSETRLIKKVEGDAPLEVTGEPVGKEITTGSSFTLAVVASSTNADIAPTYQWQNYNKESKAWSNITTTFSASQLRAEPAPSPTSPNYATSMPGIYRCAVSSQKDAVKTTLYTQAAEVKLKSDPGPGPDPIPDPDPTPTPTFYTVTLPTLVGATTEPAAGTYNVEAWGSFVFTLTLSKDYDQSKPVVKTSRGETITPRATDGKYVVNAVREDITIQITDIMSNIPTGIAGTETGDRVWATAGQLCIHTDSPKDVHIYNFSGQLQKVANALCGDTNLPLPAGNYVVVIGSRSYKVQVSR